MFSFLERHWVAGNALGIVYFNNTYFPFPLWKPNTWNTFCITLDALNKTYKTYLNDLLIFETDTYPQTHKTNDQNMILMNSYSVTGNYENRYITPFNGKLTDINIWCRILSEKERRNWSSCTGNTENGDFLDWYNATIEKSPEIDEIEENINEVCEGPKSSKHIAFNHSLAFEESVKFCENVGGILAVSRDQASIEDMKDALMKVKSVNPNCSNEVFSGYWKKDGHYENIHFQGKEVNLTIKDTYSAFDDCVLVNLISGDLVYERCKIKKCPICFFADWPAELHLRGMSVRDAEEVDSSYYLINSTHLTGKTKSRMIQEENYWKIYNSNKEEMFYLGINDTSFPLGINLWRFDIRRNEWCNPGEKSRGAMKGWCWNESKNKYVKGNWKHTLRKLKLHKAVEQPGNFCCNDGTCIPSGKILYFYFKYYHLIVCINRKSL